MNDEVDAAVAAGRDPGPLAGVPVALKDNLCTRGIPTTCSSRILAGWRPPYDATVVTRLERAGAVVVGKTVTTEFATRKPGPTTNPANPGHTPGGSSSGSAAGVAAGFFPLAYGTQTAGSVIRPAAYCGVVGFKPSYGTISRIGMKVMSDSLDTVGVMARTVADCALFAGAVSGRDLGDPEVRPDHAPRVGLCRSPSWHLAAPETVALLERVGAALERAGAAVSDRELPAPFEALVRAHPIVMNSESGRALGWELATARDGISPGLLERLEFGLGCSEAERPGWSGRGIRRSTSSGPACTCPA